MKFTSENVEVFLAVMSLGSFSAAARSLGRAPSAVSMAIAAMEAEMGFELFIRTNRRVTPTPEALALAQPATSAADHLRRLSLHAEALSLDLERDLVVAVAEEADAGPLFSALKQVGDMFPLLQIEVISGAQYEVEALMASRTAHVGLLLSNGTVDPERNMEVVGTERIVAVTQRGIAAPRALERLEDLADSPQVIVGSSSADPLDGVTRIGRSIIRVNSVSAAVEMVAAGIGWGNLPLRLVDPLVQQGRLSILEFRNSENGLTFPIHLSWLKGRPLGKAAAELVRMLARTSSAPGR